MTLGTEGEGPLLELKNVHMSFGRVDVLKGIDLTIRRGEVVALVGDNGAGKSTMIKVITGVHRPTAGHVAIRGERVNMTSVQDSRQRGIETVYQERALAGQQEIWRNVFAGREIRNALGFMNVKKQRSETEKLLRTRMGFTSRAITADSEVQGLSGGEKQGVAIARALYFEADLIILDEPTMGLSLKETDKVLDFVRAIKAQRKSVILIDHNILHVYSVADRFVILDRGQVVGEFTKDQISREDLIETMVRLHQTGQLELH
ncbi:monosaccharide ABC transporter ATP-binding protein, CUT2 family [Faunimonas pinastri]|uniref:Monosaccharide ABC transporter ATP-binding protein, CUT2 family n=1 Tax=Faunimonas pinastri TaxID=1855383 RepID=A0A1H9LHG6_9HYPH|nr:ATP-binding cassette domain-containing protein [Faunimonas pinastri]SER10689.1 monosaccharide ABC transporter ATP-binding protein, CUT2 family [Faunimonas pinastri]